MIIEQIPNEELARLSARMMVGKTMLEEADAWTGTADGRRWAIVSGSYEQLDRMKHLAADHGRLFGWPEGQFKAFRSVVDSDYVYGEPGTEGWFIDNLYLEPNQRLSKAYVLAFANAAVEVLGQVEEFLEEHASVDAEHDNHTSTCMEGD